MGINSAIAWVNDFWNQWSIRFAVLLSLFFQTILMFFAPLRKITSNKCVKYSIWFAYQLADYIPTFAIGQISQSQSSKSPPPENRDLLAFWASFLLLHLGGPDTITAYSLDDNKFSGRRVFDLLSQVFVMAYVLLSFSQNKLLVPAIIISLVGILKYVERAVAFHNAAKTIIFRVDVKPSRYHLLNIVAAQLEEPKVSRRQFFEKLYEVKGDIKQCFDQGTHAEDAYGFLCYEINKLYGRYFTKDPVIHFMGSYIFRALSIAFYLIASVLFTCFKKNGNSLDVGITYTLLSGAIALDAFALRRLIFSDDFFYRIIEADHTKGADSLVNWLFGPKWISFLDRKKKQPKKFVGIRDVSVVLDMLDTPIAHQPWSTSIYAYNLLSRCLKQRPRMISEFIFANHFLHTKHVISHYSLSYCYRPVIFYVWSAIQAIGRKVTCDKFDLTKVFDTTVYAVENPFTENLWKLIYDELQEKSFLSHNRVLASLIKESRGQWVLFKTFLEDQENETYRVAIECINGLNHHESLLAWHIATEICYNTSKSLDKNRAFSKLLSDYMCYLLVKYPQAIPGFEEGKYREILHEVDSYCAKIARNPRTEDRLEVTCRNILADRCEHKFVLIRCASELARELLKEEKWNIISKVWVEMLSYTAIHCPWDIHIEMIKEGGELLNFVRECMECFDMNPNPLEDGPIILSQFKKGMSNWTNGKEVAFVNKCMKESGSVKQRGLTSELFDDLAECCLVSLYDIVLRVKFGNPLEGLNDERNEVCNTEKKKGDVGTQQTLNWTTSFTRCSGGCNCWS